MSVVLMSKRELNRIDVLARLESGRLTPGAAAALLRVSERQVYRLMRRFREGGPAAIADRRRGRPSNNRLPEVLREQAVALVREHYADFGPTLAAEKLAGRHDVRVSRETLRSWMIQAGLWLPLAYGVFDKLQRVSHAAIVENKRLGEVLAWIKERQDAQPVPSGDRAGPRRSSQKSGLMKDRVDRLAQAAKPRPKLERPDRRRSDRKVCAPPPQAPSHPA